MARYHKNEDRTLSIIRKAAVLAAMLGVGFAGSVMAADDVEVGSSGYTLGTTNDINNLTITNALQGDLYTNPTSGSAVNVAGNFRVQSGALANGSDVVDVNMTVHGKAHIAGTYNMGKGLNQFNRGIVVEGGRLGTLSGSNATVSLGRGESLIVKDGGTLGTADQTLTVEPVTAGDPTRLLFNGTKGTNIITGTIDAKNTAATVNNNLLVDGTLNVASYQQSGGTVYANNNTSSNAISATAHSTLSGSNSIFQANGTFAGGLNVMAGARLTGAGNTITGNTGAAFDARPGMYIDAESSLDLSKGNMRVEGYSNIKSDGTILIGYGEYEPNKLTLDNETKLTTSQETGVTFTDDFIRKYYARGDAHDQAQIIDGGVINDGKQGAWTTSSLFGDFSVAYNVAGREGAFVSKYDKRDVSDARQVKDYLAGSYAHQTLTRNIVSDISGVAQNMMDPGRGLKSNGSVLGNLNEAIYRSIANGQRTWTSANGYTGSIGKDIIAVKNGSTVHAPVYVAQDSIRNVQDALNTRLDAFRAVREYVVTDFASDQALGSADILNDRYLNRFWAGGLGSWQNASARNGFDGYRYKAGGGIVGYDRAFGPAVVGASFAYVDGNYSDKTFDWNDSKIRQHNANIYATFNGSTGFFATVMGGYNYARNKLSYGSGLNAYKEKYHSNTWYASGKFGFDFMPCDNISITPSVGVNYFYTRGGKHDIDMMNAGGAAISRVGRTKNHHVELPVQLQLAYEAPVGDRGGLTLTANGGYSYNFRDKGVRGDILSSAGLIGVDSSVAGSGKTAGRGQGHHFWNAGAGAKFRYDQWEFGVKYDYIGRSRYNAHQVTGAIGYSF